MDIKIYNKERQKVKLIEEFSYFKATAAYNAVGSFELHCKTKYFSYLQKDFYLMHSNDHKHAYVIEYVQKETGEDGAEYLVVKGRSLDSIFDRRICLGTTQFEDIEPADIVGSLLNSHVINPTDTARKIEGVNIATLEKADEGIIDYVCDYSNLLSDVTALMQNAFMGFNTFIADDGSITFNTYKGINRTEQENVHATVTVNDITALNNASTFDTLDGWAAYNPHSDYRKAYSLTISGGMLDKSKYQEKYELEQGYEIAWQSSGYAYQNLSMDASHIYYFRVDAKNPTSTVLSCGVFTKTDDKQAYTFEIPANLSSMHTFTALYVPDKTESKKFVVGLGDLEEKHDQHAYFDTAVVIDLTATFGVGNEPTLFECDDAIYYDNGWKYKTKVVTLSENTNPIMAFSRDRDTLLTVEYTHNSSNEKNKMYVRGSDGTISTAVSDEQTGVDLKESFTDKGSEVPREIDGIQIPESSYMAMLRNKGKADLNYLKDIESITGTFYMLSNKKYGVDFYLGDTVDFIDNELGIVTHKRISSVTESWDGEGYTLDITLGDDIINAVEYIKLISKGAK